MNNTIWNFSSLSFAMLLMAQYSSGQRYNGEEKIKCADVISVIASGTVGGYTFEVEVSCPDTGCEQYADWWEVVSNDGALIYRRILTHSHVNEQLFKRTGGSVEINTAQKVWIRAHMNNTGYDGKAFFGSAGEGFTEMAADSGFASSLEGESPQPQGCGF